VEVNTSCSYHNNNKFIVETIFDGSKHGIELYAIQVSPDRELFVLDSAKNNILRVTPPLSGYMCVHLKLRILILFQK
jgi:hypothetical protein